VSSDFTFRKIIQSDKERIVDIASRIWGAEDFIPRYFDEWIESDNGEFVAIEYDGDVIGCARLTFLAPGYAWFQGLRKDPDVTVKGVCNAVNEYFLRRLKDYSGVKSIRFSTYIHNHGSRVASEKIGFEIILKMSIRYVAFEPKAIEETSASWRVTLLRDESLIFDYINKSEFFKITNNLVNLDWVVHPYSDDLIRKQFIETDMCFGTVENGVLKSLVLVYFSPSLTLSFIDADNANYAHALFDFLKVLAVNHGREYVEAFIPDSSRLMDFFNREGFEKWEEEKDDFLVYDYSVEKLSKLE
jgi:hypothetical protein